MSTGYILGKIFKKAINNQILLRGAISYGEYHKSENIILGPAVDEADSWYENTEWAGICLTPSAKYHYESECMKGASLLTPNPILPYKIPFKKPIGDGNDEKFSTYAVNWLSSLEGMRIPINAEERTKYRDLKKIIIENFSTGMMGSIGPNVVEKYENTLSFVDYIIKNLENIFDMRKKK